MSNNWIIVNQIRNTLGIMFMMSSVQEQSEAEDSTLCIMMMKLQKKF